MVYVVEPIAPESSLKEASLNLWITLNPKRIKLEGKESYKPKASALNPSAVRLSQLSGWEKP